MKTTALRLKRIIPGLAFIACAPGVCATEPTERILDYSLPYNYCIRSILSNPALAVYSHDAALSDIEAGWSADRLIRKGFFNASSFMPLDKSNASVWGQAGYENGNQRHGGIVESADYHLVYPYVLADTVGGRMNIERYSFAGGYSHKGNRVDWGIDLAYTAFLSYRRRDPRPRNVSGSLDINAGIGWHVRGPYIIAASAGVMKYKQSSSIMFMNETGWPVVYHLTGLGMSYNRFNSLGVNTHYNGAQYSLSVDLLPGRHAGIIASAGLSRLGIDYILKDLNNLPMSNIRHDMMKFTFGYTSATGGDYIAASISGNMWRRIGTENIFGDASANIYPLIASLRMFNAGGSSIALNASGIKRLRRISLAFTADGRLLRSNSGYLSPKRELGYYAVSLSLIPSIYYRMNRSLITAGLLYHLHASIALRQEGFQDVSGALVNHCIKQFESVTEDVMCVGANLRYDRDICRVAAIGIAFSAIYRKGSSSLEAKIIVTL